MTGPSGQRFRDRRAAGRILAGHLARYAGREDLLVLALPRDRRWPSMARASLRDDLSMEQASLTEDVLSMRKS